MAPHAFSQSPPKWTPPSTPALLEDETGMIRTTEQLATHSHGRPLMGGRREAIAEDWGGCLPCPGVLLILRWEIYTVFDNSVVLCSAAHSDYKI